MSTTPRFSLLAGGAGCATRTLAAPVNARESQCCSVAQELVCVL